MYLVQNSKLLENLIEVLCQIFACVAALYMSERSKTIAPNHVSILVKNHVVSGHCHIPSKIWVRPQITCKGNPAEGVLKNLSVVNLRTQQY